MALAHVR